MELSTMLIALITAAAMILKMGALAYAISQISNSFSSPYKKQAT